MAAEAPWRQLSPHPAGCYPDAVLPDYAADADGGEH